MITLVALSVWTLVVFAWAFWSRADEKPDGSMFSGAGQVFGLLLRVPLAVCAALAAWLAWALLR